METLKSIHTRRSIREYKTQPVPDELIQELLEAAMQAPSAGNQQPWHFLLVTDRKLLSKMAEALPFGKMLADAPLGIVVCADLELEKYAGFWVQDCSNATMNLLLAAHDLGLGAVWVGVHPLEDRVSNLRTILGLPASVIPLNVIPLGYPASTPEAQPSRFDRSRVHNNKW
jgi:nitroreductase